MEDIEDEVNISTVEMHTGGEALRIITSGYPPVQGKTILEKRKYARENLDYLRKMLMFEPRGHVDMYGALLVEPDLEQADLGVLFLHNEGYSTMCGHAVIALGRYAIDSGLVATDTDPSTAGEVPVFIQCPCGLVKAMVEVSDGKSGRVRFISVPSFAFALDVEVQTQQFGTIKVDIGYGGAFYALVSEDQLQIDLRSSRVKDVIDAANTVTKAVKNKVKLYHPESDDLAFLYGTIVTDGKDGYSEDPDDCTYNVCVFADSQVDRCPTGSGVTARIAVQYAKKLIAIGQQRMFQGIAGSKFGGRAVKLAQCGEFDAVHVEVVGHAYYTGKCTFTMEKDDPLKHGFLVWLSLLNILCTIKANTEHKRAPY